VLKSGGVNGPHYLVQVLLPMADNAGRPFDPSHFATTRRELTERFGGLTAHMRAPARGVWKDDDGSVEHDDIVIVEVMAKALDVGWWRDYRARLEARFAQDVIVVRAHQVDLL
jgi:hypothetical protein